MVRYPNRDVRRELAITSILLDRLYSTGQYFSSVAQDNQKRLLIENPADSGVVLLISNPTFRASGQIKIDVTKDVTVDTQGDPPTTGIVNKSTNNGGSEASAQIGGDNETGVFTGGTSYSSKSAGSGTSEPSTTAGAIGETGISIAVHPGDNITFGVTAIGASRTVSIDADFIQYPEEKV